MLAYMLTYKEYSVNRTVGFYKTVEGRCLVLEYIASLPAKVKAKIAWTLTLVQELERVPQKYFKKLTDTEFYECRIECDGKIYRLLGFFYKGDVIILTNGFQKKTRKTPQKEMEICEQRRKEYLQRKGESV